MISVVGINLILKNNNVDGCNMHFFSDSLGTNEIFFSLSGNEFFNSFFVLGEDNQENIALILATMDLLKKLGKNSLFSLTFREVESYLRDDNLKEAWDNISLKQNWFEDFYKRLIFLVLEFFVMREGLSFKSWEKLSIESKILSIEKDLLSFNTATDWLGQIPFELVAVEENEIILFSPRSSLKSSFKMIVLDVFLKKLQFSYSSEDIKLVAQ